MRCLTKHSRAADWGRAGRGFSLIELLLVIGVIGLMLVVAVPAINGLNRGRNVSSSAYSLHDLLDYARSEAMARNTYTWVGFANVPGSDAKNGTGSYQVVAGAFCSQDGTATADTSLIGSLARPVKLGKLKIVPPAELDANVRAQMSTASSLALTSQAAPKNLPLVGGIRFNYSITFTPQGVAMLKAEPTLADGFDEAMDIGLIQMAGDAELPSPNDVCLRVSGASGSTSISRLQ